MSQVTTIEELFREESEREAPEYNKVTQGYQTSESAYESSKKPLVPRPTEQRLEPEPTPQPIVPQPRPKPQEERKEEKKVTWEDLQPKPDTTWKNVVIALLIIVVVLVALYASTRRKVRVGL